MIIELTTRPKLAVIINKIKNKALIKVSTVEPSKDLSLKNLYTKMQQNKKTRTASLDHFLNEIKSLFENVAYGARANNAAYFEHGRKDASICFRIF